MKSFSLVKKILVDLFELNLNYLFGLSKEVFPRRLDKSLFCKAFNLIAILRGKSIRFTWDKFNNEYIAQEPNFHDGFRPKKYFLVKRQNFYSYQNGFSWRAKDLSEVYLLDYITLSRGDVVIDCGANNGDFLMALELHSQGLHYIAFEPGKVGFKTLKKNIRNHQAFNLALGEKDGTVSFYVSPENADSSIIPCKNDLHFEQVEMTSLSSFAKEQLPGSRIKLLKIEAEGYEPEVIQGALQILHAIDYIVVDGGFERGVNKEATMPFAANLLISNGFQLIAIGGGNRFVSLYKNQTE